jgi:hypothetical protein
MQSVVHQFQVGGEIVARWIPIRRMPAKPLPDSVKVILIRITSLRNSVVGESKLRVDPEHVEFCIRV